MAPNSSAQEILKDKKFSSELEHAAGGRPWKPKASSSDKRDGTKVFLCWTSLSLYRYQKQLSCFIFCEWPTAGGKQGNTSSKTRAMKAVFAVRSPQIIFTASVFGSGRGNERVSRASLAIRIHNCSSSSFQANFVFVTFGPRDKKIAQRNMANSNQTHKYRHTIP